MSEESLKKVIQELDTAIELLSVSDFEQAIKKCK